MDFGDARPGDRVELQTDLGPNAEYEVACNVWGEILGDILQDLERVEGELADMRQESQALEKAGIYPGLPSESWQPRNDKGSYLRMVFPRGTPGMPRKLYVGNKPEAIAEARQLARRRRRWEQLEEGITRVEVFLRGVRIDLSRLADRLARYQVPELASAGDVLK